MTWLWRQPNQNQTLNTTGSRRNSPVLHFVSMQKVCFYNFFKKSRDRELPDDEILKICHQFYQIQPRYIGPLSPEVHVAPWWAAQGASCDPAEKQNRNHGGKVMETMNQSGEPRPIKTLTVNAGFCRKLKTDEEGATLWYITHALNLQTI